MKLLDVEILSRNNDWKRNFLPILKLKTNTSLRLLFVLGRKQFFLD